jgi:transposase InsO family protein
MSSSLSWRGFWQWSSGIHPQGCCIIPIVAANLPAIAIWLCLAPLGIEVSMSRTANCYDNAAMESFFATLTKECTDRIRFQTRQEARSAIFEYLECFYNPIRLHSTLQYVSPLAFEPANESKMS